MKKIYAFGDSNTYGFDPRMGGMGRYPKEIRWTGVIDIRPDHKVNNQGYNGLSIPKSDRDIILIGRGIKEWDPDLVLIMIGSNDLLSMPTPSCEIVGTRLGQFLSGLCGCIPEYIQKVVLLSPPRMCLGEWTDPVIVNESLKFGTVYEAVALEQGVDFLDVSEWDLPLCYDGVHFTEEAHLSFAENLISRYQF